MPLSQLIYVSRPFGFDDLALTGILASARRNNVRDGITGALICRDDLFMQMLEGEKAVIDAAFARIRRDDRHTEVQEVWAGRCDARLFPEWAMRHDPAQSWMWSREEVSAGAAGRATGEQAKDIFERLAVTAPASGQTCPMS